MSKNVALFGLGMCVLLLASSQSTAQVGPGAEVEKPYAWVHAGDDRTPEDEFPLTDEYDYEWYWGGPPMVGSAYGYGNIANTTTGTAKARSTLNYHTPYDNDFLSIGADVETWKPFRITSSTLAPGTSVAAGVFISYDGTLKAQEGMADRTSLAYASFAASVYDNTSSYNKLVWQAGNATVTDTLTGDSQYVGTGAWATAPTPNGNGEYPVSFTWLLQFTGKVGDEYWLYFDLATSAWTSAGTPTYNWLTSATFAEADFSHTGIYELRSNDNVQFVMVPEPGTLGLLALGGLALVRRRRMG